VKERAEAGGVTLTVDVADDPPALRADERMVKQILINLLSNAIKFTRPEGKVELRVRHRRDGGFVFEVADTGIGIAREDIPLALSPFKQIDGDLNRHFEGTGLGLPLSKSLTELHGGSFELQSEPGVGTTVTVRFPVERIVTHAAAQSN
jgi:two-component system cell cycle sensor histidine kinase PleC